MGTEFDRIALLARTAWFLIVFCTGMVVVFFLAGLIDAFSDMRLVVGLLFLTVLIGELWCAELIQRSLTPHKVVCSLVITFLVLPASWMSLVNVSELIGVPWWSSYSVSLPDSVTLTYRWRSGTLLFPKIERKVQITREPGTSLESRLWDYLARNHQYITIYLHEFDGQQWLRLKDQFGEYVVNLKTMEERYLGPSYPRGVKLGMRYDQGVDPRLADPGRFVGCLSVLEAFPFGSRDFQTSASEC